MRYLVILLISLGLFSSCDKCKDISCENGGDCEDGECICGDWYTGDNCETKIVEAYEGLYSGTMTCSWYSPYIMRFADVPSEDNEMTIEDLSVGNYRVYNAVFTSENQFNIPSQIVSNNGFETVRASGSGTFRSSGLEMSITITNSTQATPTLTLCTFVEN